MYTYKAELIRVIDADTIEVKLDLGFHTYSVQKLRILNYDAPETYRPVNELEREHGKAATERAKELLTDQDIMIKTYKDKKGKYGRYIATVILPNARDYSAVMIEEGFAKRESYGGVLTVDRTITL